MAASAAPALTPFSADPILAKAILGAVESCLEMCGVKARCVGLTTIPAREPGSITGMIGVHGDVSGFITVNMAEAVARSAVGGLLQDTCTALNAQVVDGAGEITNIIAGGIKKGLSGTKWAFGNVTVPSVIIGHNYQIAYARGLEYLCAIFEQDNSESVLLDERILQVAISLIRL